MSGDRLRLDRASIVAANSSLLVCKSDLRGRDVDIRRHCATLDVKARLAQSVEHGTLNPRVVGSSPTSGAPFSFFMGFFSNLCS